MASIIAVTSRAMPAIASPIAAALAAPMATLEAIAFFDMSSPAFAAALKPLAVPLVARSSVAKPLASVVMPRPSEPTVFMALDSSSRMGPIEAAIAAVLTTCSFSSSESELNALAASFTAPAAISTYGRITCPTEMAASSTAALAFASDAPVVSPSFPSASSTVPDASDMEPRVSLNSSAPALAIASAPLLARTLPHRFANASESPSTASLSRPMTSPRLMPLSMSSPNVLPVISCSPMFTEELLSASSVSMPFIAVVALAVLMPCLVITA